MQLVWKTIDAITLVLGWLAAAAVIVMMLEVTVDVVGKYFFNILVPLNLTLVAEYYMPLVTFIPLAFVERMDANISVEVFTTSLSERIQRHLYGWTYLLSATVCAFICYGTWLEAVSKYRIGAFEMEYSLKFPVWPPYFTAPVGFGLIAFVLLLKFICYLGGRQPPVNPAFPRSEMGIDE